MPLGDARPDIGPTPMSTVHGDEQTSTVGLDVSRSVSIAKELSSDIDMRREQQSQRPLPSFGGKSGVAGCDRKMCPDELDAHRRKILDNPASVPTSEATTAAHVNTEDIDDLSFVVSFLVHLKEELGNSGGDGDGIGVLSSHQKRTLVVKIAEKRERKRKINRLSAQRKRIRERDLLETLSDQFKELSSTNQTLLHEADELRGLLSTFRQRKSTSDTSADIVAGSAHQSSTASPTSRMTASPSGRPSLDATLLPYATQLLMGSTSVGRRTSGSGGGGGTNSPPQALFHLQSLDTNHVGSSSSSSSHQAALPPLDSVQWQSLMALASQTAATASFPSTTAQSLHPPPGTGARNNVSQDGSPNPYTSSASQRGLELLGLGATTSGPSSSLPPSITTTPTSLDMSPTTNLSWFDVQRLQQQAVLLDQFPRFGQSSSHHYHPPPLSSGNNPFSPTTRSTSPHPLSHGLPPYFPNRLDLFSANPSMTGATERLFPPLHGRNIGAVDNSSSFMRQQMLVNLLQSAAAVQHQGPSNDMLSSLAAPNAAVANSNPMTSFHRSQLLLSQAAAPRSHMNDTHSLATSTAAATTEVDINANAPPNVTTINHQHNHNQSSQRDQLSCLLAALTEHMPEATSQDDSSARGK